jgi:hypothetical protein
MAAMCPIDGCKAKKGLCMHDKMMILMGVLVMSLGGAHFALHLI